MSWGFEDGWNEKYELARAYFAENGNLDIPAAYKTEDGVCLGVWYRGVRRQYENGTLSPERKKKMEAIGLQKESVLARNWKQYYKLAKDYYHEHGDLNVSAHYETKDGFALGSWTARQRGRYAAGKLKPGQIRKLEGLDIVWDPADEAWKNGFAHAKEYFRAHGDLAVRERYVSEDGYRLGAWLQNQQIRHRTGAMTEAQRKQMEAIGMRWSVPTDQWNDDFCRAETYRKNGGRVPVAQTYVTQDGYPLGEWI